MSVMYCDRCDLQVDTDFNAEHFTSDGDCVEQVIEDLEGELCEACNGSGEGQHECSKCSSCKGAGHEYTSEQVQEMINEL